MKTIYKIAKMGILSLIAVTVHAQTSKDTTLVRQITVDRDFTPSLQDVSKINTLPAINEPHISTTQASYETQIMPLHFDKYPIGDTGSGDINTAINLSKQKGYLGFGIGNYMNIEGKVGYRFLDTPTDRLDVFARYNSTNGTIDYLDPSYAETKAKAKYMDGLLDAKYMHYWGASIFRLEGSFLNTNYNYYGNPFVSQNSYPPSPFDSNTASAQNVNVFSLKTGLDSGKLQGFNYNASLAYDHLAQKYGPTIGDGGFNTNQFDLKLDVNSVFDGNKYIGVKLGALTQSFASNLAYLPGEGTHSLTNLGASPYLRIDGDGWKVSLGAKVNYLLADKNNLTFSPNITASWQLDETTTLYGGITGGINNNTYLDIFKENRYLYPSSRIEYSHTLYDASLGVKSGVINGFEFDLLGGYKKTTGDHFYIATTTNFGNVSQALYGNLLEGRLGISAKTMLIPYTDLTVQVTAHTYSVTHMSNESAYVGPELGNEIYSNTAWNLPTLTFALNAVVTPFAKFVATINYQYAGGRKGSIDGVNAIKMSAINELNARGEYQLTKSFSVNVQLNNVLNQHYDEWLGYTQQGFNVLGGINIKF